MKSEPMEMRLSDSDSAGAIVREFIIEHMENKLAAALDRAEAAEAERDALRAELVAREWRSVDEPPTGKGVYLTYCRGQFDVWFFRPETNEWLGGAYDRWPTHWANLIPPQGDDAS